MLGLKKRQIVEPDTDTVQSVFDTIRDASVPLNSERIAYKTDIDRLMVLECLGMLFHKDCIEVAFAKTGMDGVVRQFYCVSKQHGLKEVKDQIGAFMAKLQKKLKPIVDDGSSYAVRVYDHKELYMVFNRRQDARDYRSLLANSRIQLGSDIFYQKFEDGFQTEERKVS
jgi:hypothetical protein